MDEEKKYPWPLPTREEIEKEIGRYFEWRRSLKADFQQRYGKSNQIVNPNMVAEELEPYGKS